MFFLFGLLYHSLIKNIFMKKILYFASIVSLATIIFFACKKETIQPATEKSIVENSIESNVVNDVSLSSSFHNQPISLGQIINVGNYRTQTQAGWGAVSNGNNAGVYLQEHFSSVFPTGLTIGCSSGFTIKLTSASAITNFLPQGGSPEALIASSTDVSNVNNLFAGQVVALSLSVSFDQNIPNFGTSKSTLSSLVITSGDFMGWTVGQLLNEANRVLGGCQSNYTLSQLNLAVTNVNENFDNGTTVGTFLTSH